MCLSERRLVVLTPGVTREWLDPKTPNERADQMVLLDGEPTEVYEWLKIDRAIGNVRRQAPI